VPCVGEAHFGAPGWGGNWASATTALLRSQASVRLPVRITVFLSSLPFAVRGAQALTQIVPRLATLPNDGG
jgi:hypothetical protein